LPKTFEVITIYGILCLLYKEAPRMAHLQFTDVQDRPTEFLDLTSLTLDEFQILVPPFEAAFQAHMATWRLDGKPRTARRFSVYQNCPLPTPEDRLLFILAYVKTYSLQVVHGRLFGMGQSKANQWIHVLLPVLLTALRTLGDAPARSLAALAQRLGVSAADAATVVGALAEEAAPVAVEPAVTPASPLLPMTGRNGASSAPKTLLHRPTVIAARKEITRSKMSCSSMPCSSSSF
jgi:Helix-turn-helix of DDE superfamily endonuclease